MGPPRSSSHPPPPKRIKIISKTTPPARWVLVPQTAQTAHHLLQSILPRLCLPEKEEYHFLLSGLPIMPDEDIAVIRDGDTLHLRSGPLQNAFCRPLLRPAFSFRKTTSNTPPLRNIPANPPPISLSSDPIIADCITKPNRLLSAHSRRRRNIRNRRREKRRRSAARLASNISLPPTSSSYAAPVNASSSAHPVSPIPLNIPLCSTAPSAVDTPTTILPSLSDPNVCPPSRKPLSSISDQFKLPLPPVTENPAFSPLQDKLLSEPDLLLQPLDTASPLGNAAHQGHRHTEASPSQPVQSHPTSGKLRKSLSKSDDKNPLDSSFPLDVLPKPSQTSITFPSKLQNTSLHTPIVSTADISQENPNHLNLGEEGPKSKRPLSTPYSHVSLQHNILPVSSQLPPLPQGTGASLSGLSFVAVPDKSLPSFSPANASKNESSGSDASLTPPKVSRKRQVGTSPMLNGDSYNLKEPADLSGLHPQKQNDARMERSQSSAEAGCASFRSHGGCDVRTENSLQEGVQVSCPTSKKKVSRKFIGLSGTIKIAPPCNIKVPNREAVSKTDRSIGADHFKCTNVDLNTEEDLASIQRSQEWGPVFFSDGVTEKEPIASTNAVNSHQVCLRFHEVKPMEEKSIGCPRNELNPSKLSQHSLDEPPVVPLIPPLDPTNSRTIPVCPDTRGQNLANLTELTPLFPSSLEEDHSNKLLERPKGDATRSSARKPANPRRLSSPDRILSASPLSEEESRRQSNTGHYNEYRKMMSEKGGGKLQEFSESSMLLDQRRSLQLSSPVLLEKSSKEIFREKNGTRSDARRKKGIFKEKANSVSAILDIARSQGILEQNRNEQKYAGVPKIVTKQIPFSKDGNTTSIKHPTSSGKRGMSKRKNRKNPKYRFLHEEQYNESMFLGFDEGRKDIFPPLDILGLPSEDAKLEEKKGCQNVPERTKNDDESEMKNCSHGVAQPVTTYNSNQPHYDMSLKHHERRKENKDAESTSYSYAPSPKPPAGIDEVSRLTDALIGLRGLVNHSIKTTSSSRVANSLTSNASLRKKSSRKKSEKKYDEGSQDFINISHGVSSARPIKSPRKAMDYPSSQKTSSQKTKSASRSKPERREVAEDDCIRDGNASHAEERKIGEGDSCSLPGPSFERVSEALDDAVDYHSVQGRRPLIGGGGPIDEIKNAYPRGDVNVRLNNASKNGAVVEKGNKTPCDYNFKSHTPDHVTSDFGDIKNNLIKTLMDTTNVLTQVCAGWS